MSSKLQVCAIFGDIHWGKKANSKDHNDDCMNYLRWFSKQVSSNKDIDHIIFLGDWNENRSALNIATLNYAYEGAKILDSIGLPVFFVVGNHDLYHRHTREIHSIIHHNQFNNFIVIDTPTVVEQIHGGALITPYLFHEEYQDLAQYNGLPNWFGHFEFRGFQITGYSMKMPTGPDPSEFGCPTNIFSGHFHKRQEDFNIKYIGNTFPMDFSDAGDNNRGMAIFDSVNNKTTYINWDQCPKYTKTTLSNVLDGAVEIYPASRVRCIVDIPMSFEESSYLKQKFTDDYHLREFVFEESREVAQAFSETESSIDADDKLATVDELVVQMLNDINVDQLDNKLLIEIYRKISV